ncbi:MAG: cupin domain-containing protein [Paracoccaceae bacterium]|nr:cupin domain-containing protein [Paracoccaceae bacterium]
MKRTSLALFVAVVALSIAGAQGAVAHETEPVIISLTKTPLADVAGKEANVVRLEVGPGWTIGDHSHPGNIFVYVLEGSLKVEVDGEPAQILKPGDLLHEIPNQNMRGSNVSSTHGPKFLVCQIGNVGDPLTVMAE